MPRASAIDSVRRFNRFYTRQIGVLQERLLRTPFSLAEARILYELGIRKRVIAKDLQRDLDLDVGYLSRIVRSLETRKLITRSRSSTDGRQRVLALTPTGRAAFRNLDSRSRDEIGKMLREIPGSDRAQILGAMATIENVLTKDNASGTRHDIRLRSHRPGDMGWVVEQHGLLYSNEYGWDERFEGIVAGIVSEFIRNFDPKSDRCWIAELNGKRVGSIFCVRKNATTAKLRLLLVAPEARGFGLGACLVDECLAFARKVGYKKITLWTNNVLHTARHIYERRGFELVNEERHSLFGTGLIGQTWELRL